MHFVSFYCHGCNYRRKLVGVSAEVSAAGLPQKIHYVLEDAFSVVAFDHMNHPSKSHPLSQAVLLKNPHR